LKVRASQHATELEAVYETGLWAHFERRSHPDRQHFASWRVRLIYSKQQSVTYTLVLD